MFVLQIKPLFSLIYENATMKIYIDFYVKVYKYRNYENPFLIPKESIQIGYNEWAETLFMIYLV